MGITACKQSKLTLTSAAGRQGTLQKNRRLHHHRRWRTRRPVARADPGPCRRPVSVPVCTRNDISLNGARHTGGLQGTPISPTLAGGIGEGTGTIAGVPTNRLCVVQQKD